MNREEAARWLVAHHEIGEIVPYTYHRFVSAAYKGRVDVVRAYLDLGVPVDAKPDHWKTALLVAAEAGHTEVVRTLLDAGADLEARDNLGHGPLEVAVESGHSPVAALLLEEGAEANQLTGSGQMSLLGRAVSDRNEGLVELLLAHGADPWLGGGSCALNWAAAVDDPATFQRLLAAGGKGRAASPEGAELLLSVLRRRMPELARRLLDAGAPVDAETCSGWTTWMVASRYGYRDLGEALEARGAKRGSLLVSELVDAAKEGDVATIERVLAAGCDPATIDVSGYAALQRAAGEGQLEAVRALLAAGAPLDRPPGKLPLVAAARSGHAEVVELLLREEAPVDGRGGSGETALIWAARRGYTALLQRLVAEGADLDAGDEDGRTALATALQFDRFEEARLLLEAGADPEIAQRDGTTPLMLAARAGNGELVGLLLAADADPRVASTFNLTALACASREPIRDQIGRAFDRYRRVTGEMMTEWVRRGRTDRLRKALERGTDVDLVPALYAAAKAPDRVEELELLLDAGVAVDGGELLRPLQAAAESGQIEVVELLLERGADVNARSESLSTALGAAAGGGHLEVVERLLAAGARVEPQWGGRYPLDDACRAGSLETIERLIEAGATVSGPGRAPLCIAASAGHRPVIELLLARGADVDAADGDGCTPLMLATARGHADVVKRLLAAGADTAVEDRKGRSALDHADDDGEIAALLDPEPEPPCPSVEAPDEFPATADEIARELVERMMQSRIEDASRKMRAEIAESRRPKREPSDEDSRPIWDWLVDTLGLPAREVAPLAKLAEAPLGKLALVQTLGETRELIRATTPIHVLPVGELSIYVVGLHLRPVDVERGELRLVRWTWTERHQIQDVGTPRDVAMSALLDLEEVADESGLESADPVAYARANEIFGEGTFTPERLRAVLHRESGHREPEQAWTGDLAEELRLDHGMSLDTYADKLAVYDEARRVLPDLMVLQAGAGRSAMFTFDFERAARAMCEALRCWHHTAYEDIRTVFQRARMLQEQAPDAFDDYARTEIAIFDDDEATAEQSRRLAAEKDPEGLVKMLNDRGHFHQDYTPALKNLGMLYRHLGWEWALALLELR